MIPVGDQELSSFYLRELLNRYPLYTPPESQLEDFNLALIGKCEELAMKRYPLKARVRTLAYKSNVNGLIFLLLP